MMRWICRHKPNIETHRLMQNESGQALVIIAGAIVALLAIIGLGVDLGVVYVERVRLARAMDAAALAAAQELPAEKAAHERALKFLQDNEYGSGNACIQSDLGVGECENPDADTVIVIDTAQFRDGGEVNTADRITVRGTQKVPLLFMRVLGVADNAPVASSATAENIENLDIAIVYDRSGSMQEDTICYGCVTFPGGYEMPGGTTHPLPLVDPDTGTIIHCEPSDPVNFQGYWYVSIEAEHYSWYAYEADYHPEIAERPKTYWAMQRQPNKSASGPDERGAWMMVGPNSSDVYFYYTLNDILFPPDVYTTPWLQYDFTLPEDGTYWVWMRAQGGVQSGGSWSNGRNSRRWVHVGLDGTPLNTGTTSQWGPYNDGANSNNWRWSRVLELQNMVAYDVVTTVTGTITIPHVYTLDFWAAGQGFRLDKIVVTDDPRTNLMDNGYPLDWDRPGVWDAGPVETHGRTRWACNSEDPRFLPIHPDWGQDELYDDYQPIRAAKEAAKKFVRRLNPKLDQIAYVIYSSNASIREELYCKKRYGSCEDFENVVGDIEATYASGGTNIADALWDGIRVLTTGKEPPNDGTGMPSKNPGMQHYGRPNAAHIMVLMTDGQANQVPSLPSGYGDCYSDDLWPDQPGETTNQRRARECVAWFARHARNQGIVVYTIGLGAQADNELLLHVADTTGGWYYFAPSSEELDAIFENLYERIFLRLVD